MRVADSWNVLPLLAALAISCFLPLAFAHAVTQPANGQPITPANTVNCFDYYHFGSVQVDINSQVGSVVSGTPITFVGTIKNANEYPIVDGAVYVKIFRERGDGSKDSNGPDVVDQLYVVEGVSLPAGGSAPIEFTWNVPAYAASGSYKVATFFTVSHKFNLLGLPFTDDVVGDTASFRISGEQKAAVGFKKDAVKVGGEQYHFAAFPPREPETGPVSVEATITNPTGETVTVPVTWTLYSWSGNDPANALGTRTDRVTIPAGGQQVVTYGASDDKFPVYLLTGSLKWNDANSLINVRFVREGKDRLRINFPSVSAFPLTPDAPVTLFSCLHNSGASDVVPDSRLVLALRDRSGNLIHSYTYSGGVTGAMMGVAEDFTPKKTYDVFTLQAQLYQGKNLVDQNQVTYDCNEIDPALCATPTSSDALQNVLISFVELVVSLIVIGALIYFARRSSRWGKQTTANKK